jgi:dipeptidyl aminopeptidase/acylaminoacyl peptidase
MKSLKLRPWRMLATVALRDKIAIYGGSYGGYAAL